MKSIRGVLSDIFYLDAAEKVFIVYHFKEILNIFMILLSFPYLILH